MEDKEKKTPRNTSKKKKNFLKTEESLSNILDTMKCKNIPMIGIPEGKESGQGIEKLKK